MSSVATPRRHCVLVGKQLSALLQILKANGVTHYQTPEITLDLAPGQKPAAPVTDPPPEEEKPEEDDEIGDPRFLLERLGTDFDNRRAERSKG